MAVISASDPVMVALLSGLQPRKFARLITALRRKGADRPLRGRPWTLCFEDRVLLVACYWRTNLTMRQLAAVFGTSKSAAARVIDDLGPAPTLRPRTRFPQGTVLIVDGTLVPTRATASPHSPRTTGTRPTTRSSSTPTPSSSSRSGGRCRATATTAAPTPSPVQLTTAAMRQ